MEEHDIKRKLATIMVADIVGFSRLTANDEDWTIRSLGEFRKIVDEIVDRHDGRIFNTGGDSVLAEFASPVEAVRCAVDFQEAARSRNLLQPRDRQLRFRIGINLGDVMVRGTDLLGDGVNVAARLEGLAEPGGICVSGSVWDQVNGKLAIGYIDIGEQSVKNIPRPVRAYHLRVDGVIEEVGKPAATPAAVPIRVARGRGPLVPALIGAAAVIVILAAGLAWQLWPRGTTLPPAASAPPATPAATSPSAAPGGATLHDTLSARLASAAPGLGTAAREEAVRTYINAPVNKALTASADPPGHWEAWDRPTPENAEEAALESCQIYHGHPCILIAVGEAVPPAPADGKWPSRDMPRARYSGDFNPSQIPGIQAALRQRDDVAGYHSAAAPKAIALHPIRNRLFVVSKAANQRAAEDEALKTCNEDTARNKFAGPCFLYAVDNRVVLPLRLTGPLTAATTASAAPPPSPTSAANPQPAPAPSAATAAPPAPGTGAGRRFRDCLNCPEMVVVPAGRFQMGAGPAEIARFAVPQAMAEHEQPQHEVTLAKPFALAKYDITREEFAAFAKATNFRPSPGCQVGGSTGWRPRPEGSWQDPGFPQTDRDPVVCMNAIEIDAYLGWLRQTTGKAYRLPSEAEWEYAARAGSTTSFYWGDDPGQICAYENVGDETAREKGVTETAIPCRDGFAETAPVGSLKPNPWGLYDMLGNVFVQTEDCWNDTYAGAPTDGSAWMFGDCGRRVMRKASFGNVRAVAVRTANRFARGAAAKLNRSGFRVALTLP